MRADWEDCGWGYGSESWAGERAADGICGASPLVLREESRGWMDGWWKKTGRFNESIDHGKGALLEYETRKTCSTRLVDLMSCIVVQYSTKATNLIALIFHFEVSTGALSS